LDRPVPWRRRHGRTGSTSSPSAFDAARATLRLRIRPLPAGRRRRAEKRKPCPDCGATHRSFEVGIADVISVTDDFGNVTVAVPAASATASAPSPTVEVHGETLKVADKTYRVEWLRLSDGGAYMLRVFDADTGEWLDGALGDDPQDCVIAVAETLAQPE
jgi:hypothetical protein